MQNNRELITLQLGDYANHIATHFWNLEWENTKFDADTDKQNNDDNKDAYLTPSNANTTNPYKSAKYLKLKTHSKPSHSDHTGSPLKQDGSNRNLNPNICFHSNKNNASSKIKRMYTPRTIIFAAQGSEGNITSNVYDANNNKNNDNDNTIFTWNNDINIINQSQSIESNTKTTKTENKSDCEYWSDYLLPTLHEKSLFLLDGIHHFSSPFYSYSTGYDLLNDGTTTSNDLCESMEDRIRWFVESCDWFQGFQIFSSSFNSFSGFLPSLINTIYDDYNNKCILLYDCIPSSVTMNKSISNMYLNKSSLQTMKERFKLNSIISMASIWNEISNIIPISVDHWDRTNKLKLDKTINNQFYNTCIIGSCLHHYTNAVRLENSNVRLIDIINCMVKTNSMKMSMLSSCSSHLDLNMNFQAIQSIEKLLMPQITNNININQPIFPRLSCLGPIDNKYFINDDKWYKNSIFGEYSCLNGSNLYNTSNKIIKEWKQNKMILAQKQGSSTTDIELFCDGWKYDMEKQKYHLKLLTKLAAKTQSPLKWNLINNTWKLPKTHSFYHDVKRKRNDESKDNDNDNDNDDEEEQEEYDRNRYSIWSSGWSSSIIGETYLNECGQSVAQVIKHGNSQKIFGDVELDLIQHKEDLIAYGDSYAPIQQIDEIDSD